MFFRQKLRTLMYRSFKQYYSLCHDDNRKNAARLSGIVPLIADSLVTLTFKAPKTAKLNLQTM